MQFTKFIKENFNKIYLILVLIIFNTFMLQFLSLQPWLDELHAINIASYNNLEILLNDIIKFDTNPPLFFIILTSWIKYTGLNIPMLRLFPLILSNLSFIFLFQLLIKRKYETAAYVLPVLFLTTHFTTKYFLELRPYCLLIFAICMNLFFLYRPHGDLYKDKYFNNVGYLISLIIAIYSHHFGVVYWASHILVYVIHYRKLKTFSVKNFLILNTISFIIYLPWLPFVIDQTLKSKTISWIPPFNFSNDITQLYQWSFLFPVFILLIIGSIRGIKIFKEKEFSKIKSALPFILLFLAPILFIAIFEMLEKNIYHMRYLQQSFIILCLGTSMLFPARYKKQIATASIIILIGLFILYDTKAYHELTTKRHTKWKEISDEIKTYNDNNKYIAIYPIHLEIPLRVYNQLDYLIDIEVFDKEKLQSPFYFLTYSDAIEYNKSKLLKILNQNCTFKKDRKDIDKMTLLEVSCK